ncbi:TAD3 (YLR316C) [Zygosaccharomyces parabailii]|uniref:BN860_07954g1_1 n=1 Tax=Zygosaccharomyces bailii (strain CLIB 213 / ATCC 58445 / CBS 680 / BCRC 21525 / NBRC 1098 / NCYC 1416 / NRRL Y-2227) TaxID=1333698 RepID=A0A8J2T2K0_ZYGB2|nr:TAD3 (YLR316C) [Zygosaccharomyces parabailii]CDF87507.1 BN860_07954g1_1 [Zygosaccharomyces bailii CLIB 213]
MVKKSLNPVKIDYKKCIVENRLLQIRNDKIVDLADPLKVWTLEINAKDSKKVVDFIRRTMQPNDPVPLMHIKRIKKADIQKKTLRVVLCSVEMIREKQCVISLLKQLGPNFQYNNLNDTHFVPRQAAPTKELVLEWSDKYWPLSWYGNPNDQILNDYTFDMNAIKLLLEQIAIKATEELNSGNCYPIVSLFVDPKDIENPIIAVDRRTNTDFTILEHSIMSGIKAVAEKESKRREQVAKRVKKDTGSVYLCSDFDVYTTHEPCSMCSMALIHSRIKRCIFVQPMPKTGCLKTESGNNYCMHNNRNLNSKYEVFQWIGSEYPVPQIPEDTCC